MGAYRGMIRDRIAGEYLLSNEKEGRTSVREGYFEKEAPL